MDKYILEYYTDRDEVISGHPETSETHLDCDNEDGQELIDSAAGWVNRGYGIAAAVFKNGKLAWASEKWHSILNEI